jgi:hypothetical protein
MQHHYQRESGINPLDICKTFFKSSFNGHPLYPRRMFLSYIIHMLVFLKYKLIIFILLPPAHISSSNVSQNKIAVLLLRASSSFINHPPISTLVKQ